MLLSEIQRRIDVWLEQNATKVDEHTWKCKRCGDVIWGQGKRLPVHECYSLFKGQHGGFGRVEEIVFPYCRNYDKNINHFDDITCIDI
jgi:hypothetical protein